MATTSNGLVYRDVHCHLLPGIDDGCKSAEESIAIMKTAKQNGVETIVATPHYYPNETIAEFLARRTQAENILAEAVLTNDFNRPALLRGAEVAYHNGLIYDEDLAELCIGSSEYMLLELPFVPWTGNVLSDVRNFYTSRGIIPIIAHLERYLDIQDKHVVDELLDCDVLIQMNAGYITDKASKRHAKKMLKDGVVDLLGSDSHNMSHRPPNLHLGFEQILDWKMYDIAERLCKNAEMITNLKRRS